MIRIVSLILLLSCKIAAGQVQLSKIDSIFSLVNKKGKFNGNVLIAEKGKPIYNKSFGFSDFSTKTLLNKNSVFELASVSKQFTAMGIVILKEKGKLKYDDLISKYIPELAFYKNVTIRNLLNHTSGLPEYEVILDSLFDKKGIATNHDIISIFQKHKPGILFEPNAKWKYSNTGYALLASIIERVSGKSFAKFLNAAIFSPLNMTRTFVYTRRYKPQKIQNYAFGYLYDEQLKRYMLPDSLKRTQYVIWLDGIVGDGCVNSTVMDLLKWDSALYTEKLVSIKSLNEIFQEATLNNGLKTNYGFGWSIKVDSMYGQIISHTGSWPGYRNLIERHVDSKKTIIILQNQEPASNVIADVRKLLY